MRRKFGEAGRGLANIRRHADRRAGRMRGIGSNIQP